MAVGEEVEIRKQRLEIRDEIFKLTLINFQLRASEFLKLGLGFNIFWLALVTDSKQPINQHQNPGIYQKYPQLYGFIQQIWVYIAG